MRITSLHANTLTQLQAALHALHDEDIGPITIRFMEYLIADLVLSETLRLSGIDLMRRDSEAYWRVALQTTGNDDEHLLRF